MNEIDFSDFCPDQNFDTFNRASNSFLAEYRDADELPPQGEITAEIRKLRKHISKLSPHTKRALKIRESWQNLNDDQNSVRIARGGSAIDVLQEITQEDFKYPGRKDGLDKHELLQWAEVCFKAHGGEISANAGSAFVEYVDALASEAGKPFDAPKAVWRFFNEQ